MTWVLIYLGVGVLFWARARFGYELLQRRDWTEIRKHGNAVHHVNERAWTEWFVSGAFYVIGWPVLALVMLVMGLHAATGWVLERLMA